MAGIQVHTSSPINPNTPSKTNDATAAPTSTRDAPAYAAASTTAHAMNSSYSAQPGAPAMPAPSSAATAYTPPSPTRTTTAPEVTGPSPPQPGQVPQPTTERGRTGLPPPPKAGAVPQPRIQTQSTQPSQINHPLPIPATPPQLEQTFAYAQPPAGTTSIAQDLSHPPGYVQNSHASFDDRPMEPENRTHTPSPTRGGGLLDGIPTLRNSDDGTSPIWDTAVNWAKEAGRKLSVVEGEVWKKINGEK